jgi:ligand-binding sensor protein/GAF domain-containing protein
VDQDRARSPEPPHRIPPPGDTAERLRLNDLVGVRDLQSIQDTFARVFGLPTNIVHPDGTPITEIANRVHFCEDLTRTSPVGGPRCAECDLRAMHDAATTGRPSIFHCWNGLYDCAIPIAPKGETLGYFLCGQILLDAPDLDRYADTAQEIGVDPGEYRDAVGGVRIMPFDQYEASVQSMHVLAQMIADQAAAYMDNLKVLEDAVRAREDTTRLVGELDGILGALRDIGLQPDHRSTLESIADNLGALIPHDSCVIYLLDAAGRELVPTVVRDPNPEPIWAYRPVPGAGIIGGVAASGVKRRVDDIRDEPDFEQIPGLDLEPEAMLAVPMADEAGLRGVITLSRLERRTFTDHELSILGVFASQASVAIQRAALQTESTRRLEEERALAGLVRAMTRQLTVRETLAETGRGGMALLGATRAVVRTLDPRRPATAAHGLDDARAERLIADLERTIEAASARGEPARADWRGWSCLVIPLRTGAEPLAVAVLIREEGSPPWDLKLVGAYASQSSLGIENALMHDRERRLSRQYRLLSELGSALVGAADAEGVKDALVIRTPAVMGADTAFVAMLDPSSDVIEVSVRQGRATRGLELSLSGGGRLAAARLRFERTPKRSVFDAWAEDTWREVSSRLGLASYLAEPLSTPNGIVGGLFACWAAPVESFSDEERHALGVVAGTAGASLGRFASQAETDSSLHQRLQELQVLTQLAQRITGLADRDAVLDDLLAAFRELGRLDGAAFCAYEGTEPVVRRACELDDEAEQALVRGLRARARDNRPTVIDRGPDGELLVLPMPGSEETILAGLGHGVREPDGDPVLSALARYGSVALENVRLHGRQRRAISRLQQANRDTAEEFGRLERILSLHRALTRALLQAGAVPSVADSLADVMGAEVLIVGPGGEELARAPAGAELAWSPPAGAVERLGAVVEEDGGTTVVAAPAAVESEVLAWVAVRFPGAAGAVEQAAVEHGAVLTALDLLRARTAHEVDAGLRRGVLEELFGGQYDEELVIRRCLDLGFDPRRPARVYAIEAAGDEPGAEQLAAMHDAVIASADRLGRQHLVALDGAAVIAAVGEGATDAAEPFEEAVRPALGEALPGRGINIGAGTQCLGPAGYRASHTAARRGADLMRLVGDPGGTLSFRRAGVEQMLLRSNEPEAILEFIARYVEPLDRYDAGHTAHLRPTLEAYYEAGGRLEPAARALHIHVSTLRYRLGRVEELLGVDPREGDARLDLEVALRAARTLPVHRTR